MMEHGMLTPTGINEQMMQMDHSHMGMPPMKHDDPNSILVEPGQTRELTWTFPRSGTLEFAWNVPAYWYHSHSNMQEQAGLYGPIIIEPARPEPYRYDRDYVVMLSDWTHQSPHTVMSKLKKQSDYYHYSQQTVADFFRSVKAQGWDAAVRDRLDWGAMRMLATDIADVTGYTFLVNGQTPAQNWTALFKPGERVRLRLINGSALSIFDVRIPGMKMTVVQADGNDVVPTPVDELRISVADTYDIIVQPQEDKAYSLLAESLDRAGFARATLAPRQGMSGEIPALRPRPLLTMADMAGHAGHGDHGGHGAMDAGQDGIDHGRMEHSTMEHSTMDHGAHAAMAGTARTPAEMVKPNPRSGLYPMAAEGGKFLIYNDLRAMKAYPDYRTPDREIEIRLTGNMERYIWTLNDQKFSDAEPIRLKYGERVRFKLVNWPPTTTRHGASAPA